MVLKKMVKINCAIILLLAILSINSCLYANRDYALYEDTSFPSDLIGLVQQQQVRQQNNRNQFFVENRRERERRTHLVIEEQERNELCCGYEAVTGYVVCCVYMVVPICFFTAWAIA